MKDDKKYHRGGRVPTPRGQVPHPRIRGRGGRADAEARRMAEARARAMFEARRKQAGQQRTAPSPIQQPRPVRGATPIQATPQPMSRPLLDLIIAGPAPRRPTQRRRSGRQIREDMNRRMRRARRR